ncbi:hypothetical protein F7725_012510 [Dissostichus mawsoni]|uniref:Uncharacterized protein n=1 Tax=Dissostichus mawsoni TaxID=36200 RepID=A0A7J5YR27_DISMA|nr:hypothetical protein F7725_012510 [Dissostichus mawsoni]
MALVGMHLSLTTTTPFSVKDILKLEHHHDFENDFLITDQVVPMNYQHVSRPRDLYDCQAEQCVSGMQEKLHIHNSAAEEEIHEQGRRVSVPVLVRDGKLCSSAPYNVTLGHYNPMFGYGNSGSVYGCGFHSVSPSAAQMCNNNNQMVDLADKEAAATQRKIDGTTTFGVSKKNIVTT